ncbi:MAG: hypothetical protein WCH37_05940 [Synechococcaceae cyanobacterium ELA182]
MTRIPRRYAIYLILTGGHTEVVHFNTLDAFHEWYTGVLHSAAAPDAFVNVPISELEGEYLLIRSSSVIGIRVEPHYGMVDED